MCADMSLEQVTGGGGHGMCLNNRSLPIDKKIEDKKAV